MEFILLRMSNQTSLPPMLPDSDVIVPESFGQEDYRHSALPRTAESYLENHRQSLAYRQQHFGPREGSGLLSVLVATLPLRKPYFDLLVQELERQGAVVITDDMEGISIGEKRNRLIRRVQTEYFTFVDDDDWISHDYCQRIEEAIVAQPQADYISFDILYLGEQEPVQLMKTGLEHNGWFDADGILYRHIMHFNGFRTALARQYPFRSLRWGEDRIWVQEIGRALRTQARIESPLYLYEFMRDRSTTGDQQFIDEFSVLCPDYLG